MIYVTTCVFVILNDNRYKILLTLRISPKVESNLHLDVLYLEQRKKKEVTIEAVFTPQPFKGCWNIVFTHGVRMGGQVGSRKKFVRAVSQKQ